MILEGQVSSDTVHSRAPPTPYRLATSNRLSIPLSQHSRPQSFPSLSLEVQALEVQAVQGIAGADGHVPETSRQRTHADTQQQDRPGGAGLITLEAAVEGGVSGCDADARVGASAVQCKGPFCAPHRLQHLRCLTKYLLPVRSGWQEEATEGSQERVYQSSARFQDCTLPLSTLNRQTNKQVTTCFPLGFVHNPRDL